MPIRSQVATANLEAIYRQDITGATGGAKPLSSLPTASLTAFRREASAGHVIYTFYNSDADGTFDTYLLLDEGYYGTRAAYQPNDGVTPDDYNASTNPKWWALIRRADGSGAQFLGSIFLPENAVIIGGGLVSVSGGAGGFISIGNLGMGSTGSSTGSGSITARHNIFTGATPSNFTFPAIATDGNGLNLGWEGYVINQGTAAVTVKSSDSATLAVLQPGESAFFLAKAVANTWYVMHFTGGSAGGYTVLTDAATITWTLKPERGFQLAKVTLGGNRTLAISGAVNGMQGKLLVKQDATGSRTLALPAGSKVAGGGTGAIALTATANATDELLWEYDGTNFFWSSKLNYT